MNKTINFLLLLSVFSWASCKDTPPPSKMETPATNQPIVQNGQVLDINHQKELAAQNGVAVSELVGMSKSFINGSNVSVRKSASIKAEKIGVFDNQELVKVLSSTNVTNEGEAILSKSVTVDGDGGSVTLTKGKAVMIEGFKEATNRYLIIYEDPKRGLLKGEIDASSAETIIYATWFNVERKNGETGWVLGKFLKNE